MPHFIPSTRPLDFSGSIGEEKVWDALSSLDDKYTVFHSLRWAGGRHAVGEADFVVMHPERGILVIEVKSGEIEYKNGEWLQTNTRSRETKRISPFAQAQRGMYELRYRLEEELPDLRMPLFCHCVWFPSIALSGAEALPPEAPRNIVLDVFALDDAERAIAGVFSYWSGVLGFRSPVLDHGQFRRVINALCPKFRVVPSLRVQAEEAERGYIRLTDRQAALLDFLDEQEAAVIHGPAGTGKTVLALEKARRLAERGERVLLLCFNIFLRDELRARAAVPGVTIHHAHSLSHEILGNESTPVAEVLPEFEDYLEQIFEPADWPYPHVIVDEGQDLDARLLNRLGELVRARGGCFYVFCDKNQNIIKKEPPRWLDEAECRLVLRRNCRNTAEIFTSSCGVIGIADPLAGDVHGEVPRAFLWQGAADQDKIVADFISGMTAGGLAPESIAILTAGTTERSPISHDKQYAGVALCETREAGKVLFTSIRKFKGLEAEAILITDVSLASLAEPANRCLLYVGSSRARSILHIALKNDVPGAELGAFIEKLAPCGGVPKNKKGLERVLKVSIA